MGHRNIDRQRFGRAALRDSRRSATAAAPQLARHTAHNSGRPLRSSASRRRLIFPDGSVFAGTVRRRSRRARLERNPGTEPFLQLLASFTEIAS